MGEKAVKGKRLWETSENPRIQRVNRSFQSKGKRLWEIFIKWLFIRQKNDCFTVKGKRLWEKR